MYGPQGSLIEANKNFHLCGAYIPPCIHDDSFHEHWPWSGIGTLWFELCHFKYTIKLNFLALWKYRIQITKMYFALPVFWMDYDRECLGYQKYVDNTISRQYELSKLNI